MKLTKQIAAAYWGTKVAIVYPSSNFPQYSFVNEQFLKKLQDKTKDLATHYDWNKLILWPLSAITQSDAEVISQLQGYTLESGFDELICSEYDCYSNILTLGFEKWTYNISVEPKVVDYLRASEWNGKPKRAYDVGYGNIESLIKARIAIDATTL